VSGPHRSCVCYSLLHVVLTPSAFQEYTKAIDVWSVGCILAEMGE
jgi:serine/threonine protein kinase